MRSLFRPSALFAALTLLASALVVSMFLSPMDSEAARPGYQVFSETDDIASLVDAAGASFDVDALGARLGDFCLASAGVDVVDLIVSCSVTASDVATVRVQNESASTADLASTTWRVALFKAPAF